MGEKKEFRILIIDDTEAIHEDFRKIFSLIAQRESAVQEQEQMEQILSGKAAASTGKDVKSYRLDFAHQGQEALAKVIQSKEDNDPFCVAFVDMRMPPGWDGMKTIEEMWKVDPRIEMVICTAYSDQSWEEIQEALGSSDKLLILKKPFEAIEILQHAVAASSKWELERQLFLAQIDRAF